MCQVWMFRPLLILVCFANLHCADAQIIATQRAERYHLSIAVDEVSLTFHAADAHGRPVSDLKLEELNLSDDGKPPRKIVAFHSLEGRPIRAGILMDTSDSMAGYLPRNRGIAGEYARLLLLRQIDQAFVMDFDSQSRVVQSWTGDANSLIAGVRAFTAHSTSHLGGTAIFDSIYRACLNQFGRLGETNTANFILLFTDGEDNASHISMDESVEMCQRSNTAIYIFRAEQETEFADGPKTLAELASKTGGNVFYDDESDAAIYGDLRIIEENLRNQYVLVYKPAELKRDGAFHRVELKVSERVASTTVRAGYYAPSR